METLKSFLSENQELVTPVGLDASAALNGGTASDSRPIERGHGPIINHGPWSIFPVGVHPSPLTIILGEV